VERLDQEVERPNQVVVRSSALPCGGGKARPGDRVRRRSHASPRRQRGVERAVAAGRGRSFVWIWEEGACGG
jgi:hypothetical protein